MGRRCRFVGWSALREEVSGQIGEALALVVALVTALLNLAAGVLRVRETLGARDRRVVGGRHRR